MFEQWGMPKNIRFDNGKPWAHPQQRVPTSFALWLVGLGIQVIYGRPRQSTDNAVVERSHGVLDSWVEPTQCLNRDVLDQKLAKFVYLQQSLYPSCRGQSRTQAYPEIFDRLRPYDPDTDANLWQRQRVLTYIAQFRFTRRVEKIGRITHMMREYSLGRSFAGEQVTVYLDLETEQWFVEDRYGDVIANLEVNQFDYATIADMKLKSRGA